MRKESPRQDAEIMPQRAIADLYTATRATGKDVIITTEVGQHQMCSDPLVQKKRLPCWISPKDRSDEPSFKVNQ